MIRLIVHREDGAIAGLLDVLMPAGIHDLAALRSDFAKTLVLQPETLVDRGLAVLGFPHPALLLD